MPQWGSFQWGAYQWGAPISETPPAAPISPLSIDDRTIKASFEDDRTIAASFEDQQSFAASWEDDRGYALARYGMTKTGVKILNFVIGDAKRIKRTYSDLPVGFTVAKAYLTIKRSPALADADALAQVEITSSAAASGQITDAATTGGSIALYFDLQESDTSAASAGDYVYDVQVEMSGGETHTLEIGTINFIKGVTDATS